MPRSSGRGLPLAAGLAPMVLAGALTGSAASGDDPAARNSDPAPAPARPGGPGIERLPDLDQARLDRLSLDELKTLEEVYDRQEKLALGRADALSWDDRMLEVDLGLLTIRTNAAARLRNALALGDLGEALRLGRNASAIRATMVNRILNGQDGQGGDP